MRISSILFSTLLPALAAAAPAGTLEARQNLPPEDQIQIQSVTLTGNGCPAGTSAYEVSLDRTAVTVGFDSFAADIAPASARDKSCTVVVTARYPVGCITSLVENTQHGWAELGSGVTGRLSAGYSVAPGRLTNNGNTLAQLSGSSWTTGAPWLKTDLIGTAVNVGANNRNVFLIINARDWLTTTNSNSPGNLRTDDMTIAFTDQRRVPANQC